MKIEQIGKEILIFWVSSWKEKNSEFHRNKKIAYFIIILLIQLPLFIILWYGSTQLHGKAPIVFMIIYVPLFLGLIFIAQREGEKLKQRVQLDTS